MSAATHTTQHNTTQQLCRGCCWQSQPNHQGQSPLSIVDEAKCVWCIVQQQEPGNYGHCNSTLQPWMLCSQVCMMTVLNMPATALISK